jgi:hypothetical protein
VTSQTPYAIAYDGAAIGTDSTGTIGNVTAVNFIPDSNGATDLWTYEYDGRNRLVAAVRKNGIAGRGPTYRVEYTYDTFDRLVARKETGTFDFGSEISTITTTTRYLYANGQPYADVSADGTITTRYLFDPAGRPLARLTRGESAPDFYLTDRQNSVLQIVGANGNTRKRIRYSGLDVTDQRSDGSLFADRFELGGQMHDDAVNLSVANGQWFHPGLGRALTEGGPGIGLNPYPVAENSPPNSYYNGTVDTGLNATERYLGAAWLNPGMTLRGTVNGGTVGVSEWVAQNVFGSDPSQWTAEERLAWGTGNAFGTVGSLLLGYGLVGRGIGLGAQLGFRAVNGAKALTLGAQTIRASYTATATWRAVQLGAEAVYSNTTNPTLRMIAGGVRIGAGFMTAFSSLGLASGAAGVAQGIFGARAVIAGGLGLFGYSIYGLGSALLDDRVPTLDKLVTLAEFAGGLGGMFRGRSARLASDYGEFSVWRTGLQDVRWSAGAYLGQLAHNYGSWGRIPAWVAAQMAGFKTCFAPGTPMRTPGGSRNIEDIRAGDLVLSRDENNCEGPVEAKVVEEVFVRAGQLWRLDVNGQTIRTTAEHPFFVAGKGWVPCHELKVGDRLLIESGAWVAVEAVEDTGVWSTVYNLQVADYHTYFVGTEQWGFSVWAHNYTSIQITKQDINSIVKVLRKRGIKDPGAIQAAIAEYKMMRNLAISYRQKWLMLNKGSKNINVAVFKVEINGEQRFIITQNYSQMGHSEKICHGYLRQVYGDGKFNILAVYTDRQPCHTFVNCHSLLNGLPGSSGIRVYYRVPFATPQEVRVAQAGVQTMLRSYRRSAATLSTNALIPELATSRARIESLIQSKMLENVNDFKPLVDIPVPK